MFFGCSGRDKPTIKGDITGLPDCMVYMSVYENSLRVIDSTWSNEGQFKFMVPEILPDIVFINFQDNTEDYIPVMIEGESVEISGNYNYNDDIKVYGTPSNNKLEKYRQSVSQYRIMHEAIDISISEYNDSMKVADSLGYATLQIKKDSVLTLIDSSEQNFIKENPSSIVSAMFVLRKIDYKDYTGSIDTLLEQLDTDKMPDNAFLRRIYRRRDDNK